MSKNQEPAPELVRARLVAEVERLRKGTLAGRWELIDLQRAEKALADFDNPAASEKVKR